MMLRTYDIKYLAFTGVATNICVESSLRDACHLEYFPILVSDATAASPPSRQEATIGNVKQVLGWVTTSDNIINAIEQ
jgi:ureidoacrylate peracid hydrolase